VNGFLPTVGLGCIYGTEKWYASLSVPALLATKIGSANQTVTTASAANNHYFLTGGYLFEATESLKLKPSILLKAVKGAPFEYDLNLNAWIHDIIGFGVSYRTHDALVGMFELQVSPQFRIGYAYDYLISNLKTYSNGTHELMLRYEFRGSRSKKVLSPRYY
jgi:type IX secretion system PorP/SprF family membrane protein